MRSRKSGYDCVGMGLIMKVELKKEPEGKTIYLVFANGQRFRVYTDGKPRFTKELLELAIESAKLNWESEYLERKIVEEEIKRKIINE